MRAYSCTVRLKTCHNVAPPESRSSFMHRANHFTNGWKFYGVLRPAWPSSRRGHGGLVILESREYSGDTASPYFWCSGDFFMRCLSWVWFTGITDMDHIELCDENGHLLNPADFPNMMFMTNFIQSGVDEAVFVPAKVSSLSLMMKFIFADVRRLYQSSHFPRRSAEQPSIESWSPFAELRSISARFECQTQERVPSSWT